MVSLLVTTRGQRKSFHRATAVSRMSVARTGRESGRTTCHRIWRWPAPSTRAASITSLGRDRKCCRRKKVPNADPMVGRISPVIEFT